MRVWVGGNNYLFCFDSKIQSQRNEDYSGYSLFD